MSLSCAVGDMHAVPLQREMRRQTESEIVESFQYSLAACGQSLKRTAKQRPTQFLIFSTISVLCNNVTSLLKILSHNLFRS